MRFRHLIFAALLLLGVSLHAKIKVACVGNSITFGLTLPDSTREALSYPGRLQTMLGDNYEVGNFGHSGSTLMRHGHRPYFNVPEFKEALAMDADIVVIHLGINDTDPRDWPEYGDEFVTDYNALIDSLRAGRPDRRIIIARLTPIVARHPRFRTGTRDWRLLEQKAIEDVARINNVELIDFDAPLRDRQDLIHDGVHPNAEGYNILAKTVYGAITGKHGGLKLAPYYQSGMVLQRHRPLTIRGTADTGSKITLTLDGISYPAVADIAGNWQVTTAPLADGAYTMTVTDGKKTLTLTDILAGEVWVASGQSNMEFPLASAVGGKEAIAASADPLLRFYDMRAIARTDNVEWTPQQLAAIDTLGHYHPARWAAVTPDNAGRLSAVAYFFAKELRDSLKVPVGIISNAVGGSPTESWIDVNTLEAEMPEALINWRRNDYIQPWAQGRANKNAPAPHRHPYEPSYLFSAGIRPLGSPDIAGVIWYQGESNAHNTDLHAKMFPLLVDSWRREFRRQDLPFCFVQLSSINRPSWPTFRDSQRRMAGEIENAYMAVSSDQGNPTDVHPRNKRPVGLRVARQALHNVYGFESLVPSGPVPVKATADAKGTVTVTFENANGMTTSDGKVPTLFELAETEGMYFPAEATIGDGVVTVSSDKVARPRLVRYGWQPYSTSNLINADSLPATTFKLTIDNMKDLYEIEPGYERGVSAAYAGRLADGTLIVAGGCNFPCDEPLAAGAQKKFYKGIYSIDPATLELSRVGSLPQAAAYGASVSVPSGIVIIGGTADNGNLTECMLLTPEMTVTSLPALPKSIDNMAAAAIGNTIYVAGGNIDGKPSKDLFALDLSNPAKGWKKLKSMPGNPRVQPVMAAADGKLWLWGGFAGRHDGKEPSLELGGLVYDPVKDKWSEIQGPATPEGEKVATGGGAAATLSDGRIAVAGGVNKDIFLDALKNQAPDYLLHPIAWYRFNPRIFIFDPASGKWTAGNPDAMNARAGASMIAGDNNDLYLFGGELKPRIRTPRTLHVVL